MSIDVKVLLNVHFNLCAINMPRWDSNNMQSNKTHFQPVVLKLCWLLEVIYAARINSGRKNVVDSMLDETCGKLLQELLLSQKTYIYLVCNNCYRFESGTLFFNETSMICFLRNLSFISFQKFELGNNVLLDSHGIQFD